MYVQHTCITILCMYDLHNIRQPWEGVYPVQYQYTMIRIRTCLYVHIQKNVVVEQLQPRCWYSSSTQSSTVLAPDHASEAYVRMYASSLGERCILFNVRKMSVWWRVTPQSDDCNIFTVLQFLNWAMHTYVRIHVIRMYASKGNISMNALMTEKKRR